MGLKDNLTLINPNKPSPITSSLSNNTLIPLISQAETQAQETATNFPIREPLPLEEPTNPIDIELLYITL